MADENENLEGVDTGDGQATDERPPWLPQNFKDPEAFASAAKETERSFHATRRELAEARETINELIAAQEQTQQQAQRPGYDEDQWLEAFNNDPIRTMAYIAQQTAQQTVQQLQSQTVDPAIDGQREIVATYAKNAMASKYDDWTAYEDRVADAIREDPSLVPGNVLARPDLAANSLERVYKMIKADDILSGDEQRASQALAGRERKLAAQTAAGASTGRQAAASINDDYHKQALTVHKGHSPYGSL